MSCSLPQALALRQALLHVDLCAAFDTLLFLPSDSLLASVCPSLLSHPPFWSACPSLGHPQVEPNRCAGPQALTRQSFLLSIRPFSQHALRLLAPAAASSLPLPLCQAPGPRSSAPLRLCPLAHSFLLPSPTSLPKQTSPLTWKPHFS